MGAPKTLMSVTNRLPGSAATKTNASSARRKASPHGASAFYVSRFAQPGYADRVEIRCGKASFEIRSAISTYRACLHDSGGSTSINRNLIGKILIPAFKPTLEAFDVDWKQREGKEHPLTREMGHVRIDIRFTIPTSQLLKDCLRAKEFGPEKIGRLYHLLGFRIDLLSGGPLDDDIEAIRSTLRFIYIRERENLKKTLKRSLAYKFNREIQLHGRFCARCDQLTQLHAALRIRCTRDIYLEMDELRKCSSKYCEIHAPAGSRYQDSATQSEVEYKRFVDALFDEARRDVDFGLRFLPPASSHRSPTQVNHFHVPQQAQSAEDFAYHANVRYAARRMVDGGITGPIALAIDALVQQGVPKPQIMQELGISKHRFTRNCDLAIARLRHKGKTTSEICRALEIWPQSFSKRKPIGGCFDFTPGRNPLLIWWPYGGLYGSKIFYLGKPCGAWPRKAASDYEGKDSRGRTIYRHTPPPDPLVPMLF